MLCAKSTARRQRAALKVPVLVGVVLLVLYATPRRFLTFEPLSSNPTTRAKLNERVYGRGGRVHQAGIGSLQICRDTCANSRDGVCNEGRPGPGLSAADMARFWETPTPVTCDLGTDCSDCGPWEYEGRLDWARDWRPVADLAARNVSLLSRRVAQPSPYIFGFTDPKKDVDVSGQMVQRPGTFEPQINRIWYDILSGNCITADGSRRLVVDIGANFGYYTLLASSLGCRVAAWEPVPLFSSFMKWSLLINNLTSHVDLHESIVGEEDGGRLEIVVPNQGIWGTASVGGANVNTRSAAFRRMERVSRPTQRVDSVISERVLLMKVDVEGFEPQVLSGSRDLLLGAGVDNIILEYSPGIHARKKQWDALARNPKMLLGLVQAGYMLFDLPWSFPFHGWSEKIPALREIPGDALLHDASDAILMQLGRLGCPPRGLDPAIAESLGLACGVLDWGRQPQSYYATFGFNTNIWATRVRPHVDVTGTAQLPGILPSTNISHTWFLPGPTTYSGRKCSTISDRHKIAYRCPCSAASCTEAMQAVQALERAGAAAPEYVQPPVQDYEIRNW